MTLPQAEPAPTQPALVARIIGILTKPDQEWQKIDREPATIGSLYTGYVMILAAIPPVARMLRGLVFGYEVPGIAVYRPSLMGALSGAIVSYVLSLAGIFVLALIIDALAPTFQGQRNQVQALKVAAYAATASWLAGIFHLIPMLGILSILGLYSLYLFYRGLPMLMKTPADRAVPYTAVIILVGFIVFILIGVVTTAIVGTGAMMGGGMMGGGMMGSTSDRPATSDGSVTGAIKLPGGGTLDLGQLEKAAKTMEDASKTMQSGSAAPGVPVDTLKRFLPDTLPVGARRDISSGGGQIAGLGASTVTAKYGTGPSAVSLSVTDLGTMGAFAALGSSLGISGNQETATGYTKMGQVDGRTVVEEYDRTARSGDYSVVLVSRFMVRAEGSQIGIDDLKGAVNAVDLPSLEAMAK
ncbi:MAG TPA: Yip1 family protein [Aliidongia sp.]|nr:Yip1 family protein [Aliidongia sp.]